MPLKTGRKGAKKTEDLQLPWFHAHLRDNEEGEVHGASTNDAQEWQAKLKELYVELRRRMHNPVPEQGAYLRSVFAGHVRYYGVPMNSVAIGAFRERVCLL